MDAKYKDSVATANLQQMITYCIATGAQHATLVFPAGHLADKRTYLLVPPHPPVAPIRIHLVELDRAQTRLSGWHEAGRRVAAEVVQKVLQSSPPQGATEIRP